MHNINNLKIGHILPISTLEIIAFLNGDSNFSLLLTMYENHKQSRLTIHSDADRILHLIQLQKHQYGGEMDPKNWDMPL